MIVRSLQGFRCCAPGDASLLQGSYVILMFTHSRIYGVTLGAFTMFETGYRIEIYEGDDLLGAIIAEPLGGSSAAAVGIYFDDPENLEVLHATLKHATESLGFTVWKKSRGHTFEQLEMGEEENEDATDVDDIPF
jgi:hypothetical protein